MGRFTRKEILDRLKKTIADGKPIIGAGSSTGIVAKCAEIGGADLIIVYSTGLSRKMGLPTMQIGHSNKITLEMYEEISNVIENTPIIAGIEANDLTTLDLRKLIRKFMDVGYDGIINFPTVGFTQPRGSPARERMAKAPWPKPRGWPREVEMIRLAHEMDIFTMCYVFSGGDAAEMVQAGCDVVCAHVGGTRGGLTGVEWYIEDPTKAFDEACERANEIIAGARSVDPKVICLVHGGPFAEPEDTRFIYEKTLGQGFVGASSIERIPVEKAVINAVKGFKSFTLSPKARRSI